METQGDIKALFIVVNAGFAEDVVDIAREIGPVGATIINARGDGASRKPFMGITIDAEKEIIISLIDEKSVSNVMGAIDERAGINSPAKGFCFVLPVSRMTKLHTHTSKKQKAD